MSKKNESKQIINLPNIILSMNHEIKDKRNEFLEQVHHLLKKYNYKVATRKESSLLGDLSCWYNECDNLVALDANELPKYFKNIDDATNYRSKAYNYHIENVNLNHISFDAKSGMKYNQETIKNVYEKICLNNATSDLYEKNPLFEDAFKVMVDYNASLEIMITTKVEEEEKRIAAEKARGASHIVKNEYPENKVLKKYNIKVSDEKEREFRNKLYKTLMKHKHHVKSINDICDFSKWLNDKYGHNISIMKSLKYYFDDIIDDDNVRLQLFLLHRNKKFDEITTFYESDGMGYTKDEIEFLYENAEKENNDFYKKLFKLFINYDIIIKIIKSE